MFYKPVNQRKRVNYNSSKHDFCWVLKVMVLPLDYGHFIGTQSCANELTKSYTFAPFLESETPGFSRCQVYFVRAIKIKRYLRKVIVCVCQITNKLCGLN